MEPVTFVTNATERDGIRLKHFLPTIINQFKTEIAEIIVVIDKQPEEGRIKLLHQDQDEFVPISEIKSLPQLQRVRFVELDYTVQKALSKKWFGTSNVNRCQAGTPIFAFIFAIELAETNWVMKSDCDILFSNLGMIPFITGNLNEFDFVQLPFLKDHQLPFSSRAFAVQKNKLRLRLPMRAKKLDLLRRIHRRLQNRTPYMALEQIIELNIQKGLISCYKMNTDQGRTMHIPRRVDFVDIEDVVTRFTGGDIPEVQLNETHDYKAQYWK